MSTTELLPCWHCGGEVGIALHSSKFGEYWWAVQSGRDDATACKCRLFMESDGKFSLEEGEEPEDSPRAMELRARLVEKWNRRVAVTDHDFAMAVHDGELWGKCSECKERQGHYIDAETIQRQQERIAEIKGELRKSYDAQSVKAEELTRRGVLLDKLEDLAIDLYCQLLNAYDAKELDGFAERMRELGIEVDG
ncbi:MAG TPA: hypothetical protein DCP91_12885 [Eggerthellaceae bacterium]|nr:hypothetical protein [Eggerthellaceae bacterium]